MLSLPRCPNAFVPIAVLAVCFVALVSSATASTGVLYDQDPGTALSASDVSDSSDMTADDFIVPPGTQWTLTQVDAFGSTASATHLPASFDVAVYADAGGVPGSQLASAPGSFYSPPDGDPSTETDWPIELPSITLPPGHYWIFVGAETRGSNDWNWDHQTASGSPVARECSNVPGGWSSSSGTPSGCAGNAPYDVQFRLHGSAAPYSPPQQEQTSPPVQQTPPLVTLAPFPGMTLSAETRKVGKNGKVTISETCPVEAVGSCIGKDTLATAGKVALRAAASKKAKVLTLGAAKFSIPAGQTRLVTIKLSRNARKLLAKKHRVKARQTVVSHDSRNTPKASVGTVTLVK
jgi:hypothetical protein